ncbi:hypothetical protein SAMN04488515_2118 [Cognatiyoonia koreensis]|uniref:VOC domain-containing protein n=1 Tax=Cognatiyoonia koreensis TaxID=364200 RepID=A0A1I0QQW7_9RHOB|nr:VOC family protein [Cognatiyoonia koreensis]SEW29904.1 hypothetical protein SAMN04488515_2118 [Cognatiyoonia koreensis]
MTKMIFVNLPVSDVKRSRAFYTALGFTVNEEFSDDTTACIVVSEHIYIMILEHARFKDFAPRPVAETQKVTGSLFALTCESREAVDTMLSAALAHGGTDNKKPQDIEGFMYGQSFSDPDGHVFEPFYMVQQSRD